MRNLRLVGHGGNKFQTLVTRFAKKNRRVLHRQCDLYSLYLWPRVFVAVLNMKKIINIGDGKESEPNTNEPNQNIGFAKNGTEPNPNSDSKMCKKPNRTIHRKEPNRTRTLRLQNSNRKRT